MTGEPREIAEQVASGHYDYLVERHAWCVKATTAKRLANELLAALDERDALREALQLAMSCVGNYAADSELGEALAVANYRAGQAGGT